jgi:hypothetical protein
MRLIPCWFTLAAGRGTGARSGGWIHFNDSPACRGVVPDDCPSLARKRLLGSENDSGSKVLKALRGGLGPLPPSSDHRCDLLQGLGREYRPDLCVPSLVPLHAGNGPQLLEQARAVGVDGQGELARKQAGRTVHAVAVPFDLAVPSGNDREPFPIGLNAEPVRLRYLPQLLNGALPLRHLSPTRLSDHWGRRGNRTVLSSRLHEGVARC